MYLDTSLSLPLYFSLPRSLLSPSRFLALSRALSVCVVVVVTAERGFLLNKAQGQAPSAHINQK